MRSFPQDGFRSLDRFSQQIYGLVLNRVAVFRMVAWVDALTAPPDLTYISRLDDRRRIVIQPRIPYPIHAGLDSTSYSRNYDTEAYQYGDCFAAHPDGVHHDQIPK